MLYIVPVDAVVFMQEMETLRPTLVFTLLFVVTFVASEEPSQSVIDFMNVLNGEFTNIKQVDDEEAQNSPIRHPFSSLTFKPWTVAAFNQTPIMFVEQTFNDFVARREVVVVMETDDGNIRLIPYNFTNNLISGPGAFDLESLNNLSPKDFTYLEDCTIRFSRLGRQLYVGIWPDCKVYVNEKHPGYVLTLTCNTINADVVQKESLEHVPEPYFHIVQGEKFPLPSYLSDFDKNKLCS
uniref:Uncharacterized protein n=1 Tax=Biomphalaria glabrata TaxID=6526 RepID=A0A2C9M3C1_BIOGL